MYRLDWIEQLKLGSRSAGSRGFLGRVHPQVWNLGFTSLLTDISSEMVNATLPVFLVLHLHASPLAYGAVEGIYHGVAVAFLGLLGGSLADRSRRYREVALVGYAISALAKLLLFFLAGALGPLAAITALDRAGKGLRTAPRDSLISFASTPATLATSFAVHRSLDAAGAFLGPLVAFVLLARFPADFGPIWATSFAAAVLGVALLSLLVSNPPAAPLIEPSGLRFGDARGLFFKVRYRKLASCAFLLAATTAADGFLYLLLQPTAGLPGRAIPLFYVITSAVYMLLSVPAGTAADRWGRRPVLLAGYSFLVAAYAITLAFGENRFAWIGCLAVLGMHYAATEGVLTAMASGLIPDAIRASGLAILATTIGFGKLVSALAFGWLWQHHGPSVALVAFSAGLGVAIVAAVTWLPKERVAGEPDEFT